MIGRGICAAAKSGAGLFALAMALPCAAQTTTADEPTDEIVVTANKRSEPLREVAGSVSALTEESLQALNAQSLADYITRVPGVVFNDYQPGISEVVIRGIASTTYHEANQATTGYYLNQIPLVEPGFPLAIPDVDAFDLAQVEVLRGPQGTLFGSSSLGGAINYVVKEADASRYDAAVEGLLSGTRRAGESSYAIKGMVNVPIVRDRLAARIVAFERYDAGYLDNSGTGVEGSNDLRVRGVRGSLVWTPTDTTTVSALSMLQRYRLADQTYVLFGTDPRTFERTTNVPENQDTEFQLHSLKLEQALGFATMTAIGSYIEKKNTTVFDDSVFLALIHAPVRHNCRDRTARRRRPMAKCGSRRRRAARSLGCSGPTIPGCGRTAPIWSRWPGSDAISMPIPANSADSRAA
jgi:iron complex outermembrane receptor protein